MTKESDGYEVFTQKVFSELVGVEVHHQRIYTGKVSQRNIKVDVSFNYSVAGSDLLFLVECKHYAHPASVDDIEEFHSKIDDIGAHKGVMVTTVGYQDGAIKTARGRGIGLALLTTEHQPEELRYVVNSANPPRLPHNNSNFWQGNFKGPLDSYEGGLRFESMGQFLGMLCMDIMEQKRQEIAEAFKRGKGR